MSEEISPSRMVLALLVQLAVFVAAGLGLWHLSGRALGDFVRLDGGEALQGAALGFALIALMATLWKLFPAYTEKLIRIQGDTYGALGERPSVPLIVLISIAAGVGEEAALRGGLQTILTDYVGVVPGIAIASLVFALLHMTKPVILALIFVIGALFGTIYHLTGSLLTVMVGHAVYDVWALWYLFRELRRIGYFA